MAVTDYSTTPASNTTINSIDISEGCPAANMNNGFRQLMADVKTESDYTRSQITNGQAGLYLGALRAFDDTSDALSNGVLGNGSITAGSGGTDGTFTGSVTGGSGTGAAFRFVVSGGALTEIVWQSRGVNYASAPTLGFSASSGLIGASATAIIGANTVDGDYFTVPENGGIAVYKNVAGVATATTTTGITNITASDTFFFGGAGNTTASGARNTGGGDLALLSLTSGPDNAVIGYNAGGALTTGANNAILGSGALGVATTSAANVVVGMQAASSGTTMGSAVVVGFQAGFSLTSGGSHVAVGHRALFSTTTNSNSVAVGLSALQNLTAAGATAIGESAGFNATTAANLTALGRRTAYEKTTGDDCTYVGHQAGYSGLAETKTDAGTTAIGAYSFGHMTSGNFNTGCGRASGWYVTTGGQNAYLGYRCGYGNTTGSDNIAIGFYAGHNTSTGSKNIMIGSYADYYVPDDAAMTLAANTSGSMAEGAYTYRVTFVLDGVETALSEPSDGVVSTITLTTGQDQVDLANIPVYSGPKTCSARKIYRTPVGGENTYGLVTTISDNTTTTYSDTTADGSLGAAPTHPSGSIMLGYLARAYKAGQMVVGSVSARITEFIIGGGVDDTAPATVTLQSSNASGTNTGGAALRIAGGKSTGTGSGGSVILSTAPALTSGSSANPLTDWVELKATGALVLKETTTGAVATPASGHIALFAEGGALKLMNSSGVVTTL